jgi:hypothetical protein
MQINSKKLSDNLVKFRALVSSFANTGVKLKAEDVATLSLLLKDFAQAAKCMETELLRYRQHLNRMDNLPEVDDVLAEIYRTGSNVIAHPSFLNNA